MQNNPATKLLVLLELHLMASEFTAVGGLVHPQYSSVKHVIVIDMGGLFAFAVWHGLWNF